MNIYTIYKSTCITTGKSYIGFDSNWPRRLSEHKSACKKQKSKFYNDINKYGWNNFFWEIVYQSKDGDYTLKTMECFFTEQYNSFESGYNSTKGGDGILGYIHTESSKQKISNSHQGVKRPWMKDFNQSEFMREVSKRKKPGTSKSLIGNNNHKHDIIVRCPSCDKSGSYPIMKRWHFERCKLIPISSV